MRVLPAPTSTTSDVLALCLAAIGDPVFRSRLSSVTVSLCNATTAYHTHAQAAALHLIIRVASVGTLTKDELVALYADHMSATNGAARAVYDRIRSASSKCPLCGVGTVAVLDHHLPKTKYPNLAVSPLNLIPACHYCNDKKKARYPKSAEEQTLHPYYDSHLIQTRWIEAKLDHGPPPAVLFSTNPPSNWSLIERERVKRHFRVCGLATTFTANANDELPPLKARLEQLESRGGSAAVQAYLTEEAQSYSARPNSWQFAMYRALSANPWFVMGGFHSIP